MFCSYLNKLLQLHQKRISVFVNFLCVPAFKVTKVKQLIPIRGNYNTHPERPHTSIIGCLGSSGSSGRVGGGGARNMKSMQPPLTAIFFMTKFYRAGGMAPLALPGSATAGSWLAAQPWPSVGILGYNVAYSLTTACLFITVQLICLTEQSIWMWYEKQTGILMCQ